jgi:serine/threonine protein kinase
VEQSELLAEVRAALGTSELTHLRVGGQKQVYRADLEGVPVVVKVVQVPDTAHADEVLERGRREVELLSAVDSEYVVRVLSEAVEIGVRPEAVCWVEELLDGTDLGDIVSTFPWEPAAVWSLIVDIGTGLAACHELDVVHRDLSPGNVRRRANDRFTLMDPGFARHLSKTALTGVYQPGTAGYLTPEHVPGGQPTPASDIFGLGILAFQALTGELPVRWTGDDAQYYDALRTSQTPSVKKLCADVPDDLAAVVDRCLDRQPARRFLDAIELLENLPSLPSDIDPARPSSGGADT